MEQTVITSAAAQVIVAIIPIVGIVIGGTIIFFSLLWHHHETKQRIKAGGSPKTNFNYRACTLLSGLLLSGIGAALSVFFALLNGISPALLAGVIPLTTGICLIIFYKLYDWNGTGSGSH